MASLCFIDIRHGKQKAIVPGTKREVGGATIECMTCNNKREQ